MTTKNLPVKAPPKKYLPQLYEEADRFSETLSAFESETVGVFARTAPRNERVILYVLVMMLVIAVALSAVVKLDRVVTGAGEVTSVGGTLYVSPLNAGVVREIRVKPGDIVKKDQVLAVLDPTMSNADVSSLQQRLDSDDAAVARLTAEYNNQPFVPKGVNAYNEVQLSIWRQRQAEYQSNLANIDAQLASARGLVAQYGKDAEQYRKRYELAARRQEMLEPLVEKGYVAELQLNSTRDATEEMSRMYSDAQTQVVTQRHTETAARAQRAAFVEKWHSDVGALLVTTRNDLDATKQSLEKAQKLVDLNTIVAPADAIVLKIGKISAGSIAGAGVTADPASAQLFTLVRLDASLEAEINVPSQDIGFIRPGDPVSLKIDAYSYVRHGSAKGVIKSISEGSFTTDENNQPVSPYFKVRLAITEVKLRDVPKDFRLVPGMTVSGDVLVGKRTILSYLVEGALRTGSEAMREVQ